MARFNRVSHPAHPVSGNSMFRFERTTCTGAHPRLEIESLPLALALSLSLPLDELCN